MASQDTEVVESITQMVNPKTGMPFSLQDAQRFTRSAMQRRAKDARRLAAWRASKRVAT